jgi:hypothetical protein
MLVGRLLAGTPSMSLPSIITTPEVISSNPAMVRRSVVLPQPDGPSSEKNSPALMVPLMPRSAW